MMEKARTKRESTDRMLILGFDAGCGTCREIARRVEGRVGDALAVRNLSDPELMSWREEALGKDAPFTPTRFEVEGETVRAWTGKKMALPLSRKLGLSKTWQLMQALGDMPNSGIQTVDNPGVGMSRGKFLKGVGGAAVAMSVLSGVGSLAAVAQADDKHPYNVIKTRMLKGSELQDTARRVGLTSDVKNLIGQRLSTSAKVASSDPEGYIHYFRNQSIRRVVIYKISKERSVGFIEWTNPPKDMAPTRAMLLSFENKKITVIKGSDAGRVWRVVASSQDRAAVSGRSTPLEMCPPVYGSNPPDNSGCWVKSTNCFQWAQGIECDTAYDSVGQDCGGCLAVIGGAIIGGPFGLGAAVTGGLTCFGCDSSYNYWNQSCCVDRRTFWVYNGYCY